MKVSKIKHVIITSIIFSIIIVNIICVYSSMIELMRENIEEMVFRVVATRDIEPGEEISLDNVKRVEVQNVVKVEGAIYRLNRDDTHVEFVRDTESEYRSVNSTKVDDDRWAVGKIAKDKIYKGEILISERLEVNE